MAQKKRRPGATKNGRPTALGAYLLQLQNKHPGVSAVDLANLLLQTPVVNDLSAGEWIAYTRRAAREEPKRQEQLAKWRRMNKNINFLMNRVRGAPILGGPLRCAECGAKSQAERTVWCVSGCPPALGRKARILSELEAARPFKTKAPRRFRPMVPERDEVNTSGQLLHGRRAWLAPLATALAEFFKDRTDQRRDAEIAKILSLASGEDITEQMVKDRVLRHARDK